MSNTENTTETTENVDTCGCCGKVLHDDEGGEVYGVGGQVSYRCDACLSGENSCPYCGIGFDQVLKPDETGKCPHCFAYAGETTAASFTPGPWYDRPGSCGQGLVISETNGANIAVTYDERDTRLIAAAPEMLAEIEYFYSLCLQSEAQGSEEAAEDVNRLAALLAKIRGGAAPVDPTNLCAVCGRDISEDEEITSLADEISDTEPSYCCYGCFLRHGEEHGFDPGCDVDEVREVWARIQAKG